MEKKLVGIIIGMLMMAASVPTVISLASNEIISCDPSTPQTNMKTGWTEKQKILASDGAADDRFGVSVAIDSSDAIVGAYFDDVSGSSNAGSAYVFTYSGGTWTQQAKLTAADYASDDEFGYSVSISGDYAIVGAHYNDDNGTSSGCAYIFKRTGTAWAQQAKLRAGDAAASDKFGQSVDIDGDYAIVGASGKSSNQGFAYIFVRSGSTWSQQAKVGATGSIYLGYSVSISSDTVVMGAYGTNSNIGTAHIYQRVGTSWNLKAKLTSSDGLTADYFGNSVSIDKDYIIVGAPGHDLSVGGEGAAYIFEKPSTGWVDATETVELTASDANSADNFGTQVSIAGNYSVIASPGDDVSGTYSGSAYIFKKTGTSWSQQAKLVPSDGASNDFFGWSVSIKETNVLVGAYADDNTNGIDAGSAYVFGYVNQPPSTPSITGTTNGKVGTMYPYTFTSTDPDGDNVFYFVDWGDSTTSGWFGPYPSGVQQSASHSWSQKNTYTIKVKAKDTWGAESGWGTLTVTMPNIYDIPFIHFWEKLLERFPHAFPFLRFLLRLQ
jgi:hypothetical protein